MASLICYCNQEKADRILICRARDAEVLCPGKTKFHLNCTKFTPNDQVIKFVCDDCKNRTGDFTVLYKLPRSSYDQAEMDDSSNNDTASEEEEENTDEEMEDDDKENDSSFMIINEPNNQEYVVDKIMDHGICAVDNKSMKFLIRWEGYCRKSEWTWEFEKDLYKVYE